MDEMMRRAREERERLEHQLLAPAATKSDESRGRAEEEEHDEFRTAFERDRDRVVHSKAFRRLKHKTQVFLNPDGDHFVTRMTHTIHVNQVGRAMARALGLNEDLTEAICLGHDVGHSPFGHTGEDALTPLIGEEWLHSAHGVRTVELLEPLNLSYEVLDGIRSHSWKVDPPPETPEGWLCRYADRIAYLTHDVSDALRAGVLDYHDLPVRALTTFGATAREWIGSMITAVIETSHRLGVVAMDDEHLDVMGELRDFMFERVYLSPESEVQKEKAVMVIQDLVGYYQGHPDEVPDTYTVPDADPLTRAVDYVAGMTDRYALRNHDRLFRPSLLD
ncbi:MAG TPA: HD domain-containing protein [Acidimicrobiia bacterium]|jgi:dGTPase|nr:HD domain-containing protein [Acidimicrobiia bacterium]